MGLGLQPDPTRKPESPGAPLLPGLSGGQLSGTGVFSLPTPLSWAGLCPAPPRLFPRAPAALGWVAEPSCFRDPRRCPPGSLDCVAVWGVGRGGERGWAGVQGRKLLTRRAKDRVVPYPRSHPCALPPCFLRLGGLLLFLLAFPAPSIRAHPALRCMDPQAWAARKEHGELPTNAKKTVGGATPLPRRPPTPPHLFHAGQSVCVECQHPPCPGPSPSPPRAVSEIAHDYCKEEPHWEM